MRTLSGGRTDPLSSIHGVNQELHDKYEKAKKAIRGLPAALTVYNVCCTGERASALSPRRLYFDAMTSTVTKDDLRPFDGSRAQKMGWLKSGLDNLADHWRMPW